MFDNNNIFGLKTIMLYIRLDNIIGPYLCLEPLNLPILMRAVRTFIIVPKEVYNTNQAQKNTNTTFSVAAWALAASKIGTNELFIEILFEKKELNLQYRNQIRKTITIDF